MTAILIALSVSARPVWGGIQEYEDFASWQAVAGPYTTIDFTGFTETTAVTSQYADLGILFTDGNDLAYPIFSPETYPQDGFGLDGNGWIAVCFAAPISWIAAHHPGTLQFELYQGGRLVATSTELGGGGVDFFTGVISDEPFDAAILKRDVGGTQAFIDNLYFGPPIPGPAALAVFACGLLTRYRRRS